MTFVERILLHLRQTFNKGPKLTKMSYGAVVNETDDEVKGNDASIRTNNLRWRDVIIAASSSLDIGSNAFGLMMHSVLQQRDIHSMEHPKPTRPSLSKSMNHMSPIKPMMLKVYTLGRNLTGAAAHWFHLAERDL